MWIVSVVLMMLYAYSRTDIKISVCAPAGMRTHLDMDEEGS